MINSNRQDKNVLLIEDNTSEAELIQRRIQEYHQSITCEVSRSIDEALETIYNDAAGRSGNEDPPDLILLDIFLNGESGFYLLSELKSNPSLQKIPVVVLTGSNDTGEIQRSYRFGANAFVSKPDDIDRFNRMIGSLTDFWLKNVTSPPREGTIDGRPFVETKDREESETKELAVLVVDDNPRDRQMIQRHLEGISDWRIRCREAGSAEETRRTLSREDPALIILDYKLPKESGISVLSSLRGNYTKPMLPVIMTSGQGNENLAGRSIREGAMDYVPKDELSSGTLRKSIERVLERYGHLRAGRNRERLVEPHTLKDELTGLLNWRYFLHRLDEELSRLDRYNSFFSLVALRLDNYDELVDRHGQPLAKKFLERIGHLLRVDLRTSDIIGRHNRDSFWIISPGTPADEARLLARRLSRKLLEGLRIPGESERLSSALHGGIISVNSREQDVNNLMNAHLLVRKVRTVLSKAHQPEMMDILSYESFQDPDTAS